MRKFILGCLVSILFACGSSPVVDSYILQGTSADYVAVAQNLPKVFIKSLIFPDYLDRPQMIIRKDQVQIEVKEFKRWAEPLKVSFLRVFNESMLQEGIIATQHKQFRQERFNYQLSLEVLRFEASVDNKVNLKVQWVLLNNEGKQILNSKTESIELEANTDDFSQKVSVQSQTIAILCVRLAKMIKRVDAKK